MRKGFKALGLSLVAVLGLMAFGAAGALAQLPGESKLGEFTINEGAALLATVTGEQVGVGTLLIPGRNLAIHCGTGKMTYGKIYNSKEVLDSFLFAECVAWNFALTAKLPCTILSPGEPVGSTTASVISLPILHGGIEYVLMEPHVPGGTFVTVEMHGAECPAPLNNPVKGSVSTQIHENHSQVIVNLFSPAIQLLTGDQLTWGGFPAYIDAVTTVELTGEHAGEILGVL